MDNQILTEKLNEVQTLINKHNLFLNKALSNINIKNNDSINECVSNISFAIGSLISSQEILKGLIMATYEYKCTNEECEDLNVLKETRIPISEYSEDKLPLCEKCNSKTFREYSAIGHQTFSDGYKG